MSMKLDQLRSFLAVVRSGSFTEAARERRLTQPAVSLQMRELEAVAGMPLFERVGGRARPSDAGLVLLGHAERIVAEAEAALAALRGLGGQVFGRIRIGTGATAAIYLLPPQLGALKARHPELDLTVTTGNAPEITARVVDNELDLALVSLPVAHPALTVELLGLDPVMAVAPPGGAHVADPARPEDFAGIPLILYERAGTIRGDIDAWFAAAAVTPTVAMELGNIEGIKRMVGAGLGTALISAVCVAEEVADGRLRGIRLVPPLHRRYGLIRRRDKPATPAFIAVLEALRAAVAAMAGTSADAAK
jgi:DNA-binding transcriptional LysR family regulator